MPPWRELIRVLLLFAILTVVMTWPQAAKVGTQVGAHFDSYFSMWRLSWIAHQLATDPTDLFSANIFYPQRYTLALSDPILLEGFTAAPLLWLGASPVLAYNLLVLASFVLSGTTAWLLARRVTGSAAASVIAGVIFAFAPYRFEHYVHLEILWGFWMPLALLALHIAVDRGTVVAGLRTGLVVIAQALSCLYYAVYLGMTLALGGLLLVRWRDRDRVRVLAGLALGAVAAVAVMALYLQPLLAIRPELQSRSAGEAAGYSATLASYLATPLDNRLYGQTTGWLGSGELRLFPGLVAVGLAIGALWWPRRFAWTYVAILAFATLASFGMNAPFFPLIRGAVELVSMLRVPARFAAIGLCALGVLAAMGTASLLERLRSDRTRGLVLAAIGAAMLTEYSTAVRLEPVRLEPAPVYRWLARQPRGAVIELPVAPAGALPGNGPERQYYSTFHWQPLLNGYSGYYPLTNLALREHLRVFPRGGWIDLLLERGARYVVVHERELKRDVLLETLRRLELHPQLHRVARFPDRDDPTWVYERQER